MKSYPDTNLLKLIEKIEYPKESEGLLSELPLDSVLRMRINDHPLTKEDE